MPKKEKKRKESAKKSGGGGGGQVGEGWLVSRLGVVGDVQYWGCKPRIEGIVKCT